MLRILPNLDLVVTDPGRITPNERALLERICKARGEAVYRLSRDKLLDAAHEGISIAQVLQSLTAMSGLAEAEFPQTVRVFFSDLDKRLGALREGGHMLVLESDDPLLLAGLARDRQLSGMVQLGKVGERTVLLVPESEETGVRRQLKKLGYVPGKRERENES